MEPVGPDLQTHQLARLIAAQMTDSTPFENLLIYEPEPELTPEEEVAAWNEWAGQYQ